MPQPLATRASATQAVYVPAAQLKSAPRVQVDVFVVATGPAVAFPVPFALDMDAYLAPLLEEARRLGAIPEIPDGFPFEPDQD